MSFEPSSPYTRGLYQQAYSAWSSESSPSAQEEFYPYGEALFNKWQEHLRKHGAERMTLLDMLVEEC